MEKISFLFILTSLFFLTSCVNSKKINTQERWNITFDTAKNAGICYYTTEDIIQTEKDHLTIQNRNPFSVHVTLFNKTLKGKIENEADIDGGGILLYYNINPQTQYSIGVRVVDGKGVDTVNVVVYGDCEVEPYALKNNN